MKTIMCGIIMISAGLLCVFSVIVVVLMQQTTETMPVKILASSGIIIAMAGAVVLMVDWFYREKFK